jgi:hypothetical protein
MMPFMVLTKAEMILLELIGLYQYPGGKLGKRETQKFALVQLTLTFLFLAILYR